MRHIFVFGSNLAGRHGRGAAKYAHNVHGAEYGVGEGLTGDSYALPTKDINIKTRLIGDVRDSIYDFVHCAKENPDLLFFVTPIGTGLAGFTKKQIGGIFKDCTIPNNVVFTKEWFEHG